MGRDGSYAGQHEQLPPICSIILQQLDAIGSAQLFALWQRLRRPFASTRSAGDGDRLGGTPAPEYQGAFAAYPHFVSVFHSPFDTHVQVCGGVDNQAQAQERCTR